MIRVSKMMTVVAVSLAFSISADSVDAGGFLRRLCGRTTGRSTQVQVRCTPAASNCNASPSVCGASACGGVTPTTVTPYAIASAPCQRYLNFSGTSVCECNMKMNWAIQCCIRRHGNDPNVMNSCINAAQMAGNKCRFCVGNPGSPICKSSGCGTSAGGGPVVMFPDPPAHCNCATGVYDCGEDSQCVYNCSYACYLYELCQNCTPGSSNCPEECRQYFGYCPECCTK